MKKTAAVREQLGPARTRGPLAATCSTVPGRSARGLALCWALTACGNSSLEGHEQPRTLREVADQVTVDVAARGDGQAASLVEARLMIPLGPGEPCPIIDFQASWNGQTGSIDPGRAQRHENLGGKQTISCSEPTARFALGGAALDTLASGTLLLRDGTAEFSIAYEWTSERPAVTADTTMRPGSDFTVRWVPTPGAYCRPIEVTLKRSGSHLPVFFIEADMLSRGDDGLSFLVPEVEPGPGTAVLALENCWQPELSRSECDGPDACRFVLLDGVERSHFEFLVEVTE